MGALCAAMLLALAPPAHAADSVAYKDPETGFTFAQFNAQYVIGRYITYRIATPSNVAQGTPYDAVVQVAAPVDVGWTGLAWGGYMTYSPPNGGLAERQLGHRVVPLRHVGFGPSLLYPLPPSSFGATYTLLTKGTHVNSTYWQYTAKCTGCTAFKGQGSRNVTLNPTGENRVAFAYSRTKPSNPSSSGSAIQVHDVTASWTVDFGSASNANFAELVQRNA
ncbi:CBD9-like protein [Apiospora aurea]|uniref:CBD9-like protein n=1 Tax=Apiospora aurea TaxID=335848 RepID=A0ABR1Q208_9PEZI